MKKTILKLAMILLAVTLFISCKKDKSEKVYTDAEILAESKKVNDFFSKII